MMTIFKVNLARGGLPPLKWRLRGVCRGHDFVQQALPGAGAVPGAVGSASGAAQHPKDEQGRGPGAAAYGAASSTSNSARHPSFHFTNEETEIQSEEVTKLMKHCRTGP